MAWRFEGCLLVLSGAEFHAGQVVRALGVALLVALGLTERPALHWAGLVLLAGLQLAFVFTVTPSLD